jgi:probable O-glycosylation ligase (exosortase A-associated)
MILLVNSRQKLRGLILVIIASFGLRALVATVFFISTGGQYRIWGPDGTFLADNNDFALGLNMVLPMFFFMARSEESKWMRIAIRVLMVCVIISVIGTYSRGGLVGLSVTVVMLVLNSRHKIVGLLLLSIGLCGVLAFTTTDWKGRMGSFTQGNLDESAESRIAMWRGGWRLVQDYPLAGGGFDVYTDAAAFSQYVDDADKVFGQHGPHSIYFQTLGEQGFVGLALFLGLIGSCFLSLRKLRRRAALDEKLSWAIPYTRMFEISLLAYMANGATLGRAYFDLFYQIVACIVVLKIVWQREVAELFEQQFAVSTEMEVIPA